MRDFLLTLVQLVSFVAPFGIKEVDDVGKLCFDSIKLSLGTFESFFKDALKL